MAGLGAAVIFAGTKLRGGPLAVGLRTVSYSACDYWWWGQNLWSICILWWWSNLISWSMSYRWRGHWRRHNFSKVWILKSRGWWRMIIHNWSWWNRHRRSWCARIYRSTRSRCGKRSLHSFLMILSLLQFKLVRSGLSTFSVSKVGNNCEICSSNRLLYRCRCLILRLLGFFLLDFLLI